MTDLRQAAQQALEALEGIHRVSEYPRIQPAVTALRTALEQQAEAVHGDIRALKYRIHELEGEVMGYKRMLDVAEAASQPQQQTEPVAELQKRYLESEKAFQQQADPVGEVIDERGEVDYISYVPPVGTALYTTPPQRQWVGLTDEEKNNG